LELKLTVDLTEFTSRQRSRLAPARRSVCTAALPLVALKPRLAIELGLDVDRVRHPWAVAPRVPFFVR
jgi:hypothetical protein